MLRELPKLVPYCIIVRYEDMRDDFDNTLDRIREKFHLDRIENPYKQITQYKGTYTACYFKKPILIGPREQEIIKKSVDAEQETLLGYIL